jgi:hypothetical protein
MARGWESKAVEAQQDEVRAQAHPEVHPTSAEIRQADVDRKKIIEGLELQRASVSGEFELLAVCRLRARAPAACARALEVTTEGVSGARETAVSNISFVRFTGLGANHVYGDAGVGITTNELAIGNGAGEQVETVDLPAITTIAWNLGVIALAGPARIEARSKRTGYATRDGDMTIEDRASITGLLTTKHATLSLAGFAARTRWWTSKMDPGSSAATGGGELGLATRIRSYDLKASVGLARSFYPVLDGGALDSPAVGFRSTVHVSRSL